MAPLPSMESHYQPHSIADCLENDKNPVARGGEKNIAINTESIGKFVTMDAVAAEKQSFIDCQLVNIIVFPPCARGHFVVAEPQKNMTQPLLPARFLFHFAAPCNYRKSLWTAKGADLDESYRLVSLAELEGRSSWADVRAAWNEGGLAFTAIVRGKRTPPFCDQTAPEQSDGLHLWIDTRDVHNVHRAGRFCHRFAFLPQSREGEKIGSGRRSPRRYAAFSALVPINRAKDFSRPESPESTQASCTPLTDGYILDALIPAAALVGFDPSEYPRLGFTYAAIDRELGEQTFGVAGPMPYQQDPSLWATLELVR